MTAMVELHDIVAQPRENKFEYEMIFEDINEIESDNTTGRATAEELDQRLKGLAEMRLVDLFTTIIGDSLSNLGNKEDIGDNHSNLGNGKDISREDGSSQQLLLSQNSDDQLITIIDDNHSNASNTEDIGREDGSSQKVWIFPIVNLGVELISAAFDQLSSVHKPECALVAMLMAFVGLLGGIVELAYKGRKKRVSWRWDREIPWFYYSTTPAIYTRFGTFSEIVGLVCAILQTISAMVAYIFYARHADNPIKASFWPIVFALGLLCSRFLKDRSNVPGPAHED